MAYSAAPALSLGLLATAFSIPTPPSNAQLGIEYGLKNQYEFVSRSDVNDPNTGILRTDAILALITLSNGEDRSYGTPPSQNSGSGWTYDQGSFTTQNAIDGINSVKLSPDMVKYYSMVAGPNTYCRSNIPYTSYWGQRYINFSNTMNGRNVDICNVDMSAALSTIAQDIQGTPLPFRRNFLVIPSEPNQATIQVIKFAGGDTSNPVTIPQDPINGWTYSGFLTAQFTIDSPISMDQRDGYMIELHGTAKLMGSDLADVVYQNTGTVSSN
jgi:hypothetical protein